jgi:enamine deaminase RidA (YjgF/YER057c/UK114 family)
MCIEKREDRMAASVRFSNPATLAKPPRYSYVVEATGPNRTVYLAGQLGVDHDNKFVGAAGDFRAQCVQAFENMTLALKGAGARWSDVVKINNYLVAIEANMGAFREVRDCYLNTQAPPASTTIGVPALARPGGLFEIEAIAVLPAKAAKPAAAKHGKAKLRARRRTTQLGVNANDIPVKPRNWVPFRISKLEKFGVELFQKFPSKASGCSGHTGWFTSGALFRIRGVSRAVQLLSRKS